jgi:hypothetical protein
MREIQKYEKWLRRSGELHPLKCTEDISDLLYPGKLSNALKIPL